MCIIYEVNTMFYFLKSADGMCNFRVRDNAIKDVLSYYQKGQIDRKNILSFAHFKILEISLNNPNDYELKPGHNYNLYIVNNNIEFVFNKDQYIPRWFKAPNVVISATTLNDIYTTKEVNHLPSTLMSNSQLSNSQLFNDAFETDIFDIAPFETVIDHYTAEKNYKREYEPEIINFDEIEEAETDE